MLSPAAAECITIKEIPLSDSVPWKYSESLNLSRNAVPVSHTTSARLAETYPSSISRLIGQVMKYATCRTRKSPARPATAMWARRISSRFLKRFRIRLLKSMRTAVAPMNARATSPKTSPSIRPEPFALKLLTKLPRQSSPPLGDSRSR